jgi:enamine deaminase RidA (YjgF/YER057c/UK114 family)
LPPCTAPPHHSPKDKTHDHPQPHRPAHEQITIHNETVYLCGQVGGDEGDVADQTRECLRRVEGLLAEAGSSPAHILQAVIWLADMSDFTAMNAVWDDWVPAGAAPARACGEAALARPELKVEIIITAAVA